MHESLDARNFARIAANVAEIELQNHPTISRPMNIEETLKAHIGKELISGEKTDLDLDTDLIGLVDSTGVMELTVWIESTFGFSVEIDDITPENFGTIRHLAVWIRRNSTQPAE